MKAKEVIDNIRRWSHRDDEIKQDSSPKEPVEKDNSDQYVLIDELTEKLMDVEIKLASAQLQGRHEKAQSIVRTHMIAGSSLALMPVPIFDLAALTGTQLSLLRSLSMHYQVNFDEQKGKVLLTSLVSGAIPLLTVVGLSSFSKLIPGIGSIGGGVSMTVLTNALIYATGQVFIRHFELGGTLEDFQSKHWKSFFTQKLEEQKVTAKQAVLVGEEKSA